MVVHQQGIYRGANNRASSWDLSYDNAKSNQGLVVFLHGYKGYKDWGPWNAIAKQFCEHGLAFLKFNFSHNGGTVEDPIDFPDLEAFGQNRYSFELTDVGAVFTRIHSTEWPVDESLIDRGQIHLIGHSRGGGIAQLFASQNTGVKSLTTWASVADYFSRFPQGEMLNKWKENGVRYVVNGRTKQNMPHQYSYYQDYQDHEEELHIQKNVQKLSIPHLIVHGENDEAVSINDAHTIHSWSPMSTLLTIPKTGHTFDTKHPWESDELPEAMQVVVERTIAFIEEVG